MPGTHDVVAPGLTPQGWKLLINGKPIWNRSFAQVWHQKFSPDGKRLAAVVATSLGRWTIAVDGAVWKTTFGDAVLPPVFQPERAKSGRGGQGKQSAGQSPWTACPGTEDFDMIWDPVFSPDGENVAARADPRKRILHGDER